MASQPRLYSSYDSHPRYLYDPNLSTRVKPPCNKHWRQSRTVAPYTQGSFPLAELPNLSEMQPFGRARSEAPNCAGYTFSGRAPHQHASVRTAPTVLKGSSTKPPGVDARQTSCPLQENSSHTSARDLLPRLEASGIGDMSVNHFFSHYTLPNSRLVTQDSFLEYLPAVYSRSQQGSCLSVTVCAVAYAHAKRLDGCEWMQESITLLHDHAVSIVEEALSNEVEAEKDSTLISLFLLSVLENTQCRRSGQLAWHHYIDQAVELLCKRNEKQFSSLIGVKLFRTIYVHMLIGALCTNQSPVLPISVWEDHYDISSQTQLIRLVHRTAVVRSNWHKQSSSPPSSLLSSDFANTIKQCKELAADLQVWNETSSIPASNPHRLVSATYWNIFRACSILLHQVNFQCFDLVLSNQHLSGIKDAVAVLLEHDSSSPADKTHGSAIRVIRDSLLQSTQVITTMVREIQASVVQLLLSSTVSAPSSTSSTLSTDSLTATIPFIRQDCHSLQRYALMFPVWAALSSQQLLLEASSRDILSEALLDSQQLRRRVEWLKDATRYIWCECCGIDGGVIVEDAVETPELVSYFVRVQEWLNGVADGEFFDEAPGG